jgi:hypothetical protein
MQVYASTQAGSGVATLPAGWAATIPCAVDTVDRVFANAVSTTLLDNTPQRCINHCAVRGSMRDRYLALMHPFRL